jgi:hypothetical protein
VAPFFRVTCKTCSGPIEGRRADALYCSERCANSFRKRQHYAANPEQYAAKRHRDNSDAPRRMLARSKHRAKIAGIPFNITLEDIRIPELCPVLGFPLIPHQGRRGYHPNSPSLDRIIPALGYTKGNVRVISARANLLKNDATTEELRAVLSDLERLRNDIRL